MANWETFKLKTFTDDRGSLTPVELKDYTDFEVKRFYTVFDSMQKRGGHAHYVEEELFVVVKGDCLARIHDGEDWHEIRMTANKELIYVGEMVWHEFDDFSDDCVLLALSSTNYNSDRSDYVEDFEEFVKLVANQ